MARNKKKTKKRDESSVIAEIAKIDRDLAQYISQELNTRKEQENIISPAYIPTRIGEQPVPTVSNKSAV
jgi:hypothetical protein